MKRSNLSQRLRTFSLGLLVTSIGLGPSPLQAWEGDNHRNTPIVKAIRKAEPAVVNIQGNKTVTNTATNGVATKQEVNGMGTGVIIDRRGLIITNYHVVDSVEKIEVTLADGTSTIAKLINYDPDTDLAMIKINVDRELPVINVGRSDNLMRGEPVIAIGNPFGYQNTVTQGIISALHRDIPVNGSQQYTDLIQTNADINPGNSGGPLLNVDGEVIGINVAVRVGAQGIGFAIPIDNAMEVMADLVAQYRRTGSHGLVCSRIPTDSGFQLVLNEYRSSDSDSSDHTFKNGDVIKAVAGQVVKTKLDIELALLGQPSEEPIEVEVHRDGETVVQSVVLQKTQIAPGDDAIVSNAWERLGIRLAPVPASAVASIDRFNREFKGGLKILEVRANSPAARSNLNAGDIIVGIMMWQTPDLKSLRWIMENETFQTASSSKFHVVRRNRSIEEVAMNRGSTRR